MQPSHTVQLLSLAAAGALLVPAAQAQTLRADRIITGVSSPIWVGSPPTDSRIFVAEQTQYDIEVFSADGTFLAQFADLTGIASGTGERGLLSLAFDPDYANNGFVYVYYTYGSSGSRIERYTVDAGDPNKLDLSTATTIIEQSQPFTNHNGGNLLFGPDGYLYFAWGDGGSGGDPGCRAQDMGTLLGKMIRIDVHGGDDFPADPTKNYAIPATNPFLGVAGALPEIFHLGLRNPWRWSFDPHTGDMYIGDVGQNSWEEVSFAPAGAAGLNFGWKIMEGDACFGTAACTPPFPTCNDPSLTDPIHVYSLSGPASAVIGGVVYRGCAIPELYGTYFFGDVGDGAGFSDLNSFKYDPIGGLTDLTQREAELEADFAISGVRTWGTDSQGEILLGDSNEVFRIVADGQTFTPDGCDVSVSAGGVQDWTLDSGAGFAGSLYFVGGSLTGISGIPAGAVVVPLTLDFYTLHTLSHPNQVPLINTFGTLDGAGTASASFAIPGGVLPPSLVGTRAYHAYVTLNGSFVADSASNPVALDFQL